MTSPTTIHAGLAALLPRLRRFARSLTCNRDAGDGLVQAALERALGQSAQYQAGARLDSSMFRIIKHAWIDTIRSRGRREQLFAPDDAGEQVGEHVGKQVSDSAAEAHRQRLAIQKAMSLLSEDHRIVIGLVLVDGLPYKEAADVLELPMGTLTSRLARAREALQGLLSDQARTVA